VAPKTIGVVTPCYNEEDNIRICYETVRDLFANELPGYRREHLFCDNCSTDRTLAILREIAAGDPCVRIVANARNFGPLRSNYNGAMEVGGDVVLLHLPADLQDPPELLPQMVKLWEQGYDIVYGIRATREEGFFMRAARKIYYRFVSALSTVPTPPDVGDFQLVDRRVVEAMRQVEDAYPYMRIMTFEAGGRAVGLPYTWRARKRGFSKNSLRDLLDHGLNGIITFTTAPMRLALYLGFVMAAISLLYAVGNFIMGAVFWRQLAEPGIMTLIVAMFFFGGVQLFFLGLLGEYILAIYAQVRKKPLISVRERVNFPEEPRGSASR
jgi:glycosyltransferase involved in cell wall biosynthesis